jgi:cobalt transporter subunit CbtB
VKEIEMDSKPNASAKALAVSGLAETTRARALLAPLAALFLGAGIVFLVGFSHIMAVHNAAHDTRHSLAFPCH